MAAFSVTYECSLTAHSHVSPLISLLYLFFILKCQLPKKETLDAKTKLLILFHEGGQFCPTSKSYSHNFNFCKVTQKRYQICARNLFPSFFNKTKITNKSRDLHMTSLWNSSSILRSNYYKFKSAVTLSKNDI